MFEVVSKNNLLNQGFKNKKSFLAYLFIFLKGMTAKQRRVAQQLHWQALNKAKSPSTPTRVFSSQDGTAFSMAGVISCLLLCF